MIEEIDCEFCPLKFANTKVLKLHIKFVHKSEIEEINRIFTDVKLRHCEVTLEKLSKNEIVQRKVTSSSKAKIQCEHCDKIYGSKKAFVLHNKSKHLGLEFECESCDMKFTTPTRRLNHFYKTHKRRF